MTEVGTVFQTVPRPHPHKRQWSRFAIWAWSPIISFQVGLTAGYVALVYFGISALLSSPPSIDLTTPHWYAGYWAAALILGAIFAAIGSISRHKVFELMETFGSGLLTLTIGSYSLMILWLAYGTSDIDKSAAGAGFVALMVPILVRFMWLLSQLLRK